MSAEKTAFGWRVFGLGIIAMALVCFVFGGFDPGQPVPKSFPERALLGYVAAAFMLVAGAAIEWRRTAAWGAAALAAYYAIIVVILMNGPLLIRDYREYDIYESLAEQLAITAGALIIYAANAEIGSTLAARLTYAGRILFGICAVIFGGAHFAYFAYTATLVPKWLPPSQEFWVYATAIGHIAAGLAIISGVQARLGAILLTAMYVSFTLLVHIPTLFADPARHFYWSENAVNIALIGAAWVVADSLARPPSRTRSGADPDRSRETVS
jgi:uncharacterized membrane protein YphA (DoxX/SURF4 family)